MIRDWPGLILRLAQAREWDGQLSPRVFVLGGAYETRVTVIAQQTRAINLAWALHRTGRLKDRRVGVVGAGAAGATFAAAASLLDAKVMLFDEHEEPISTQRWSFDRYLHPNLFDWPIEGWDDDDARLPLMSWRAGSSARVRLEQLAGFVLAAQHGGLIWCSQHSVSEVRTRDDEVVLTVCDLRSAAVHDATDEGDPMFAPGPDRQVRLAEVTFDEVVVASGFLPEPSVAKTTVSGSYWKDNDLTRTIEESGSDHAIIGDGDGALTELMRIRFDGPEVVRGFQQRMLVGLAHQLLAADGVGEGVLDVEADTARIRGRGTFAAYAGRRFDAADAPVREWLRDGDSGVEIRAGRVTAQRNAFAINRLIAARLTAIGEAHVRLRLGEPLAEQDVTVLSPTRVVWRTGARPRQRTVLIRPAFRVRGGGDALSRDLATHEVAGLVDELLDASRERRWDARADDALADRSAEPVLADALALEMRGVKASHALKWKLAPWQGFVDEGPLLSLSNALRDLAALALAIRAASPDERWSNFQIAAEHVELSLDLVAAATDLTPTEVVDRMRREGDDGISLALVWVKRGDGVPRLWIRVRDSGLEGRRPAPDWTPVSLLLAPAFGPGDLTVLGTTVELRKHRFPSEDTGLNSVVTQMLKERRAWAPGAVRRSATVMPPDVEQNVSRAVARDPWETRARLTVLHRQLASGEDEAIRDALSGLSDLARSGDVLDETLQRYLQRVLALPPTREGADALEHAARAYLRRRDPATGQFVPVAGADLDLSSAPVHVSGTPDLAAFAIYVDQRVEPRP